MSRARIIRISDVARCPRKSLLPTHYNDDGSCRCCGDLGAGQVTGVGPCVLEPHETGAHQDAKGFRWGGEAL